MTFSTSRETHEIRKLIGTEDTLFAFLRTAGATQIWTIRNGEVPANVLRISGTRSFDPTKPILVAGEQLFFQLDGEIWKSDGTIDGTNKIADLPTGADQVSSFVAGREDEIWFTAANGANRLDLNTGLVTRFANMRDVRLRDLNGTFVLASPDGVWRTGGVRGDNVPLIEGNVRDVRISTTLGNLLFFITSNSTPRPDGGIASGNQLWRTDGTV